MLFEHHGRGIVSRNNFEWNKNDFSRNFKTTTNASEFVTRFQAVTTFNRVHQVVFAKLVTDQRESLLSQETLSDMNPDSHDEAGPVSEFGNHAGKRPSDEAEPPPPVKKSKKGDLLQMSNDVELKKVGEFRIYT